MTYLHSDILKSTAHQTIGQRCKEAITSVNLQFQNFSKDAPKGLEKKTQESYRSLGHVPKPPMEDRGATNVSVRGSMKFSR
jgi:hypothetical protein